ncbi:hypothetical protein OAT18_03810 [Tenacibaculum sp.]|nr:hypothetical protein [Tenacibaculum sp.]
MGLIVILDEKYNVDFDDNFLTGILYRGFSSLYLWFVPHILTLIGLIGWGVNVIRKK